MSALDILKNNQAKINRLREEAEAALAEVERLESENSLACRVAAECEEKVEEKKMYDSEALATLYTQLSARFGSGIDADITTFCETTGLDLPAPIKPPADEEEAQEAVA